jgi:hypothetical protein
LILSIKEEKEKEKIESLYPFIEEMLLSSFELNF